MLIKQYVLFLSHSLIFSFIVFEEKKSLINKLLFNIINIELKILILLNISQYFGSLYFKLVLKYFEEFSLLFLNLSLLLLSLSSLLTFIEILFILLLELLLEFKFESFIFNVGVSLFF